jgi:hypothetical protein
MVRDPALPMVKGPATTQFSSAEISTAELIVAGFLNTPENTEET